MRAHCLCAGFSLLFVFEFVCLAAPQGGMPGMTAMENSVGFLSSGTSIEPLTTSESAPMIHTFLGNWALMVHANGYIANTQQSGPRGRDKLYSGNWLMPMVSRDFGRHTLSFRTMLSLEPATVTKRRYPELFQSGETAYGLPIVDGQHPHELIMELAGRYDFRLTERTRLFVYGGPRGEPGAWADSIPTPRVGIGESGRRTWPSSTRLDARRDKRADGRFFPWTSTSRSVNVSWR